LEDPGAECSIILRWKFMKWDVEAWTVLIWLRIGVDGALVKSSNESSASIKCGEFLN
jgi:hypothetical protein